ncbi:Adaptin ear-binding coat-associated protein 2 [Pteropus alecto]|uniref:Adaptin ear-binding coat-associated protein 2 n=1 Tax=Pteropus alecto TaxID=9402 RepID=L5KFM4_PTEAL|nr:Adaptin ear-binding coat-associated protein 2 [Pteropus alecto]
MEEGEYESVLCVKPEVHVYRIPPRATNRGYRAAEWQLDQPSWSGRLRITAKGQVAYIKLEDRTSGELFAQAPVDQFPGTAVESVTDSSRYFVIRIEDGNGRRAFIGIGFGDRGDAFDFNVALQDHFKWVKQQCEFAKQAQNPDQGPKLDLGFKEGQTIKLNIANVKKKEGAAGTPRARPASAGGLSLLPPPPGGKTSTLIPPPGEHLSVGGSLVQPAAAPGSAGAPWLSLLLYPSVLYVTDWKVSTTKLILPILGGATVSWPQPKPASTATADIWGDFTKSTGSTSSQTQPGTGWVQF